MDVGADQLLGNRYRLGRLVGRGGMSTVHAATDVQLGRQVAVKLFHPGADEIAVARLQAEARLLAGLSHPGLLRVFDVSSTVGRPYLVMELVNSWTLRAVINRGPIDPGLVAGLGARLADTLRYVHSKQIVHRDIKPSNVLLDEAGNCYLADFGIARAIGAARLTGTGHCVGTAGYLAPEQVAGEETGPPADIYSLGLVLLECLTGQPEYPGAEVESAIARLSRPPRIPDRLPPMLGRALAAMTARDPRDRPDAGASAELLEEYRAAVDATKPAPSLLAGRPENPTRVLTIRRRWGWRVARAAMAVTAAGIAVITILSNEVAGPGTPLEPVTPRARPNVAPIVDVVPSTAAGQVVVAPPVESVAPSTTTEEPQARPGKKKGHRG